MNANTLFDPDLAPFLGPLFEFIQMRPRPELYDYETHRTNTAATFASISKGLPKTSNVSRKDLSVKVSGDYDMPVYWYSKTDAASSSRPGPAIVYLHGGGYVAGDALQMERIVQNLVADSGIPVLNVEYRMPPEHPFPTPVEDSLAAVKWLQAHAAEYNVDPARLAVVGASAGGGLAASTALLARERNLTPPLKQQLLFYPMLDDTNTQNRGELEKWLIWGSKDNATGWGLYLGKDVAGTDKASPIAAPIRQKNLGGLPKTYIDVGTVDIFVKEDIEYARRLLEDGTETELHVIPGATHVWEEFVPDARISKDAKENRLKFLSRL